ncbi:DUF4367 domain-containing protein [Bacillus sp. Marseille-Q1617]|uniref:DUF4367 domain-containing protein n=1 Tax=Bacillus sp. Marseille-Q1617 TaxID=2736887 RepID=UPI00158E804F|nr:DUF4367 domain-containing protein [Bacillus sp. Marseille-Q1617]
MPFKRLLLLFLVSTITLTLVQGMIQAPLRVQAKENRYNHNSIKIEDLVKKADFSIFIPERIPQEYTLEIKMYPESIRLHYMNKEDTDLSIGIEQRKAPNAYPDSTFQDAESVLINGNNGFFKTFSNAPGGILSWKQDGTFLEMYSHVISKQEMIEIARSMKIVQ